MIILRKVWRLPRHCHTQILHCVAGVQSLFNKITELSSRFVLRALTSKSQLITSVFSWASSQAFTAVGGNNLIKWNYVKLYSDDDKVCADFVRDVKLGRISFTTQEENVDDR